MQNIHEPVHEKLFEKKYIPLYKINILEYTYTKIREIYNTI